MATIKSFTSLEQSRKLAKILSKESADMEYLSIKQNGLLVSNVPFMKDDLEVEESAYNYTYDRISCWSLAALLSVLPKIYGEKPKIALNDNSISYPHFRYLHTKADNLLDSCYEMILRIKKYSL